MSYFLVFSALFLAGGFGFVLKLKKIIPDETLHWLVAIWAGAMIGVSVLHIFPEATVRLPVLAAPLFLSGFVLIYLIENAFMIHTCVEHDCHFHHVSLLSWLAIFIHTLFDGVAIAVAFSANISVGYAVLAGVIIHQIPVSLSLASLLRQSKFTISGQSIFLGSFALAAPVGFSLSKAIFSTLSEWMVAGVLAFSGGTLLYLWASDLLPNVHKKTRNHIFIASLFVMTLAIVWLGKFFE